MRLGLCFFSTMFRLCTRYNFNYAERNKVGYIHCYIHLLYLRIIHLILQPASGPGIICDFQDYVQISVFLFLFFFCFFIPNEWTGFAFKSKICKVLPFMTVTLSRLFKMEANKLSADVFKSTLSFFLFWKEIMKMHLYFIKPFSFEWFYA